MILSLEELLNITKGKLIHGSDNIYIRNICIDSRKIIEDCLFIPIVGERFDGHDFILDALSKGAAISLTSKEMNIASYHGKTVIFVEDTLKALHDIAKYVLVKHKIPVIGVTGSTGKTTTKELIYNVLSQEYNVLKNKGNFNNQYGLPLTLFEIKEDTEIAVLEMGMSSRGEIDLLANLTTPEVSVITNIGLAHIEALGSQEEIFNAKMEITNYFNKNCTLVANGDDKYLMKIKNTESIYSTIFVGLNDDNNIVAQNIKDLGLNGIEFDCIIDGKEQRFKLKVPGIHNVYNALIAIAIGKIYNVKLENIYTGLLSYSGADMRLNTIKSNNIMIINDCYNANPDSMNSALDVLKNSTSGRKIAILGDMLEMGDYGKRAHEKVGHMVYDKDIDILFTVGNLAKYISKGAVDKGFNKDNIFICKNNSEVINQIDDLLIDNDTVLIKGSRGMKMEEIVQYLQERR